MTPAIKLVQNSGITYSLHEYAHDPAHTSYGLEAAQKLAVTEACVFKTLVVSLDGKELVIAVIPVSSALKMKSIASAGDAKKAAMAARTDAERATGYVLGGVSPLGQKKRLRTFIDSSATDFDTIYVSGGRRGLEIELSPGDLKRLTEAMFASMSVPGRHP